MASRIAGNTGSWWKMKRRRDKMGLIIRLRNFLIRKLAGKSAIVLNSTIRGTLEIKGYRGFIYNNLFLGPGQSKSAVDIKIDPKFPKTVSRERYILWT